jgi:hypothetical protein
MQRDAVITGWRLSPRAGERAYPPSICVNSLKRFWTWRVRAQVHLSVLVKALHRIRRSAIPDPVNSAAIAPDSLQCRLKLADHLMRVYRCGSERAGSRRGRWRWTGFQLRCRRSREGGGSRLSFRWCQRFGRFYFPADPRMVPMRMPWTPMA